MSVIATKLLCLLLSEKVIIKVLMKLGDWLVKKTSNTLDDEIWGEVKKVLEADQAKGKK